VDSEREATLKKPSSIAIGAGFAALIFGSVHFAGCTITTCEGGACTGFDDDGVFECSGSDGGAGGAGSTGTTTGSIHTYVVSVGTTGTGNNATTGVTSSTGSNPTSTSTGSGPGCGDGPACVAPEQCIDGACHLACVKSCECPTGELCEGGRCVEPMPMPRPCTVDCDCPSGELCIEGGCAAP